MLFDLKGRISTKGEIVDFLTNMTHGDYFLLKTLRYNMRYILFEKLILAMTKEDEENLTNGPKDFLPMYDNEAIAADTLELKNRNLFN